MSEGHRTPAGKNVLEELDLDAGFIAKSTLAIRILKTIRELGLTQREAAKRMPITQARLSLINRGKLDDVSQEKLEACLRALGHDVEIRVGPRREGVGKLEVREAA
jgi:predicted XRE-type DNA-binding protein